MPFKQFSLPSPGGDFIVAADEDLAGQDIARQHIYDSIMSDVDSELAAQGKARQTISRAIQRPVTQEIKATTALREGLSSLVTTAIDQELGYQDVARTTIGNALLVAPGTVRVAQLPSPMSGRFPPPGLPTPSVQPTTRGSGLEIYPGPGWYCYRLANGQGALISVSSYGNWLQAVITASAQGTGASLLGPYPGEDMARAACTVPPTPPPPSTLPPVLPPGTLPPDSGFTPGWYCIDNANGGQSAVYVDSTGVFPEGTFSWSGPYNTQTEAQAQCGVTNGTGPQPQPTCDPCPQPETCPQPSEEPLPPPAPACALIDFGEWTFPPIGSEEFCQRLPATIDFLTRAGQALIDWLNKVKDDVSAWITWLQTAKIGSITGVQVFDYVIQFLAQTAGNFQKILWDILSQLVNCYMDLASRFPGCNPTATLALVAIKTLLSSLHNQRIGSDAGVWWTLDVATRLPQWEQLIDYLIDYLCPYKIPSVVEAITTWTQGQITADQRDCWMKMHGVSPAVWQPYIISMAQTASAHDLIYQGRRLGMDEAQIDERLTKHGWTRDEDRLVTRELYTQLPALSQYMAMVRKDALNDELADRWSLDVGFDDLWGGQVGQDLHSQGVKRQTAGWEYRMTWAIPSIGEAREFSWRARADVLSDGNDFTDDDWQDVLTFRNVPEDVKAWHTLVRYRPLSPAEVQQLVIWHLATPDRLKGAILDSGMSPRDADMLAELEEQRAQREAAAQKGGWTLAKVVPLIRSGLLPPGTASDLLQGQGYSDDNISSAVSANSAAYQQRLVERGAMRARMQLQRGALSSYQLGTVDRDTAISLLRSTGWDAASAETAINGVDLQGQQQLVKQILSLLRGEYLKGILTETDVRHYLMSAGLTDDAVQRYMALWAMERTSNRKLLSASQAIRMVYEGLLPAADAGKRLANMGWHNPDTALLLAEVSQKIAAAQAKEIAAQERQQARQEAKEAAAALRSQRAAERQAKAIAAAQKAALHELEKEKKRLEAAIAKSYPKSELKAWLKGGLITADFVRTVLQEEGYTEQAITLLLEQWTGATPNAPAQTPANPEPK